tara:strand:+ start:5278 stop:6216 length:939 start_codon:yes stop_codon:yes gene_type:complete
MNRGTKLLLIASRTLVSHASFSLVVPLCLIAFFIWVAAYYLVDREQSFTVQAATQSITVTVTDGPVQVWSLGKSLLCLRHGAEPEVGSKNPKQCEPRFFSEHEATIDELVWPVGAVLTIAGYDETRLSVAISLNGASGRAYFGDRVINDQSVLFFERNALRNEGSLALTGKVKLGQPAETGAVRLLRAGKYEIRENLGLSAGSSVVVSGTLMPGDYAEVTDRMGSGIPTSLFLTQTAVPLSDFEVILTTPPQNSMLLIKRVGSAVTEIRPTWTDRLVNDAMPLAVSILLGLFGASLGIAKNLSGTFSSTENK